MPTMGQPDYVNQLLIPLGADLLLFLIKAVVILLFAGFFVRKYIAPLFKKETKPVEPVERQAAEAAALDQPQ
ncbi:hypothetical protein [Laceyella putida]|uniref:Uncharacterized protein n=1 Tax=Laceyella putida TaxID=110101 RepID=A0ABW2RHN9_9BACL